LEGVEVGQQTLVDVPVESRSQPVEAPAGGVEGKVFCDYRPDQMLLMPPSLDECLPADHLARFVAELVEEHLDLSVFYAAHTERRGAPPYDVRMMLKLLLYGYVMGVRSSRGLQRACVEDVAFRFLATNQVPDHRSYSRFRRRHLDALEALFDVSDLTTQIGV
jgi:transposase